MTVRIIHGDCRDVLRTLPDESVHCCVTSPPYYGLRDYGVANQMGLEPTPEDFVRGMVEVFREVRRVLRSDGTLWLNIGDSYSQGGNGGHQSGKSFHGVGKREGCRERIRKVAPPGLKSKDLIGIPWMLAFALRADGWYLRQDIIWSKPNPMPESVTDRCTKAHEYLFLLSKSKRYHYDTEAISEEAVFGDGSGVGPMYQPPGVLAPHRGLKRRSRGLPPRHAQNGSCDQSSLDAAPLAGRRNKRSVWTVPVKPFRDAHFATFPPELIEPCILAGCQPGGVVLDPFGGAGTTGLVADRLLRDAVLIELNRKYVDIARRRIERDAPLLAVTT